MWRCSTSTEAAHPPWGAKCTSTSALPVIINLPCPLPSPATTPQVRTHLRNMVIIPEMIGSVVGVYNGKTFNQVGRAGGRGGRGCCGQGEGQRQEGSRLEGWWGAAGPLQ